MLYQQTRSRQNLGEPGKGAKVRTSERGRGQERALKRKMTRQGGVQKEPGHDVRGILERGVRNEAVAGGRTCVREAAVIGGPGHQRRCLVWTTQA